MLDLLRENEFYSRLDNFYTSELQSVVFYGLPDEPQKQLTSYKRAFADLVDESDLVTLQLVYDSLELVKIFKNNKAVLQSSKNNLYKELYRKLILTKLPSTLDKY